MQNYKTKLKTKKLLQDYFGKVPIQNYKYYTVRIQHQKQVSGLLNLKQKTKTKKTFLLFRDLTSNLHV